MKQFTLALLLASGSVQLSQGLWIHAKATLAQVLIASAWQQTKASHTVHKPWSWADTWPVAKLTSNELEIYILEGAQGNSLAFGPGHMSGTALPGEPGISIIAGHRDTHFAFLKDISIDDRFSIETTADLTEYTVTDIRIADIRQSPLTIKSDQNQLLLITCYPFDQIQPGGPLRLIVSAEPG